MRPWMPAATRSGRVYAWESQVVEKARAVRLGEATMHMPVMMTRLTR